MTKSEEPPYEYVSNPAVQYKYKANTGELLSVPNLKSMVNQGLMRHLSIVSLYANKLTDDPEHDEANRGNCHFMLHIGDGFYLSLYGVYGSLYVTRLYQSLEYWQTPHIYIVEEFVKAVPLN